jgi:hypothetical protein
LSVPVFVELLVWQEILLQILAARRKPAPAFVLACASGWAVNDKINSPIAFGCDCRDFERTGR